MQVTLSINKVFERKMGDIEGLDKNEMKNVQGKLGTKKREFENSNSLFLWCQLGSNQRHKDFQSFALPTEL